MTAPTPERRVGEAELAEIVAMEWDGLRPDELRRDLALDLLDERAANASLTAERNAVEVAVRKLCPLDNNEGYEDEDGDAVVYRCINEDGDAFIETESLGEAVEGVVASYDRVCGAFEAKCEENHRLTAEVERLTKEKAEAVSLARELSALSALGDEEWGGEQSARLNRAVARAAALSLPAQTTVPPGANGAPPEAGTCPECNGPVYHRDGKPGEFDHECSAPPGANGAPPEVTE